MESTFASTMKTSEKPNKFAEYILYPSKCIFLTIIPSNI